MPILAYSDSASLVLRRCTRYEEIPDDGEMACRRDYRPQLQPVPGGDVLDRIRSAWMDVFDQIMLALSQMHHHDYEMSLLWHFPFMHNGYKDFFDDIARRQPMTMVRAAGATTGRNCSLCQAGTFLSGSGGNIFRSGLIIAVPFLVAV